MSDEKEKLHVAVDLEGVILDKAIAIKEKLGVKSWAEMLRIIVTQYYNENKEKIQKEIQK